VLEVRNAFVVKALDTLMAPCFPNNPFSDFVDSSVFGINIYPTNLITANLLSAPATLKLIKKSILDRI